MLKINLHQHLKDDIRRLKPSMPGISGKVEMIVTEMQDNPDIQDALLVHMRDRFERLEATSLLTVNISRWVEQYNPPNNRDLWRLKPFSDSGSAAWDFRIVYCYIPAVGGREPEIHVLAVLSRDEFDYDSNNIFTRRILKDYESLV